MDVKIATLDILKAASAVTTLVPSARITISWPTTASTLPCITANLVDSPSSDAYDNAPRAEDAQVEVHIFCLANTNGHAISNAVSNAMQAAGWWRDFKTEMNDPILNVPHWVMRFSNKIFL